MKKQDVEAIKKILKSKGQKALANCLVVKGSVEYDVTSPDAVIRLIETLTKKLGKPNNIVYDGKEHYVIIEEVEWKGKITISWAFGAYTVRGDEKLMRDLKIGPKSKRNVND